MRRPAAVRAALVATSLAVAAVCSTIAVPAGATPAARGATVSGVTALASPPRATAQASDYAKVGLGAFEEAGCLLYITRSNASRLLTDFGGFPAERPLSDSDAFGSGYESLALAHSANGTTVLAGVNSMFCMQAGGAALSAGRKVVSVFWNVEYDTEFAFAVNGKLVVATDTLDDSVDLAATYPALRPFLRGFRLYDHGSVGGVSGALALAERITGARLTSTDVARMVQFHRLVPYVGLPVRTKNTVLRFAWRDDQERAERLAERLRTASPSEQRATTAYAVREAVTRAGLARRPQVARYLSALSGPAAPRPPSNALVLQVREAVAASEAASTRSIGRGSSRADARITQQGEAMYALFLATNPDAGMGVFGAVDAARSSLALAGSDLGPALDSRLGTAQ